MRDRLNRAEPTDGAPRVFCSFWAIPLLFFVYGLMAFGGGFVLVPAYVRDFVGPAASYLQLVPSDFANVMALTEMTPGPVAVNCATYFGYMLGGVPGALTATFVLLLPGYVIMTVALHSLERFKSSLVVRGVFFGVRPITAALLSCATWSIAGMSVWFRTEQGVGFSAVAALLTLGVFVAVRLRKLGPIAAIFLAAAISVLLSWTGLKA